MDRKEDVIDKLKKCLIDHNIRLTPLSDTSGLPGDYKWIRFELALNSIQIDLPVNDEYNDVALPNPPLLLQLVLLECESYEEADDFLVWCRELGLDPANLDVQTLYRHLGEAVPRIREIIGPDIVGISSWDFEMNTQVCQALRKG